MKTCTIYLIINISNNKIYIGQTWQSLKDRWSSGRGYRESAYFNSAIQKYGVNNFKYEVLALCSDQEIADYLESYYIDFYNSRDKTVGYNLKEGGSHGRHSEETKIKISIANTGKLVSEETKQKLREINSGKKASEETKRKMALSSSGNKSRTGQHLSDEERHKLSEIHKGHLVSLETRQKISLANTGRKRSQETISKLLGNTNNLGHFHSDETKKKISDACKGIIFSEEHRKKLSESRKGKEDSEETKKRRSEAQHRRQAKTAIREK